MTGSEGAIVAIGSDHAGFHLKAELYAWLREAGYGVQDWGTDGTESVDYPDFARAVAEAVAAGQARWGLLVCGTGIGMCMGANRIAGVRAANCGDATAARLARAHNDANVMTLGARLIGPEVARDCVLAFLGTDFDGGDRHRRRVAKLG